MVKTIRIIMLLGIMTTAAQILNAQVKIGDNQLDIGDERLLEIELENKLFIVTDSLEIGRTTSRTTNMPGTLGVPGDALMMKLYGYGLGNFQGSQSYFLGTNPDGEVLEFPLSLNLETSPSMATLSLFNGTTQFGSVDMTLLDSVFANNTQLSDSINTVRTLLNDLADDVDSDLDTIQINELIDDIVATIGIDGEQTLLTFYEDRFVHDTLRSSVEIDLNPYFATDKALDDTTATLRGLIFYVSDGTLTNDRTVTGDANNLTFTDIDSFNISSSNTTFTTTGNTDISSTGNTDISSDGEISITTTSSSNITIDASSDSINLIGTVTLDEYVTKPIETTFNNILGLDADGNVINISATSILGTEEDSVIYRHNGSLSSERFMTMAGNDLNFVGATASDSVVITADGRILIGRGTVTPGNTTNGIRLDVNGDILAIQVHSSSDERFKKNINPIGSALDKVMSIEGVTYDFRVDEFSDRNFPTTKQLGFIAQNVEEVLPEVVRTNGDGYKAVDYAKVTALLNEAIKEQQKQISTQAGIIKSQEEQLTALVDKMNDLSRLVSGLKIESKEVSSQSFSMED